MTSTFKGNATCSVCKIDDGHYIVQLTITDLPTEQHARRIAALVEEAVTEKVRAIGGKLESWE